MAADSRPDLRSLADSLFAQVTCRQFPPDARVTEHVARRRPQTDYPAFVSSREFTCERRSSFSAASPRWQPRSSRSGRLSAQLSHECLSTHSFSQKQMHPAETNFVFVCFFLSNKAQKKGERKTTQFLFSCERRLAVPRAAPRAAPQCREMQLLFTCRQGETFSPNVPCVVSEID